MTRIKVIIPAFNEEDSIAHVIKDIPKDWVEEIIVVNNSSTDQTAINAEKAGVTVLHESNRGYGYACLKGIEHVAQQKETPDVIVFMDADYSDFPNELPDVVSPIIHENMDMVIGARTKKWREKGSMTPPQVFGNWLASFLMRILYGAKFTDLGPFRAIKFEKLMELCMQDKTYGWTVEMQIKALKKNYRYTEVPVHYRNRIGVSKISGTVKGTIMAGYKILSLIFKYSLR
jgi:glycosyltransferase involved in cell wall biosynthesis